MIPINLEALDSIDPQSNLFEWNLFEIYQPVLEFALSASLEELAAAEEGTIEWCVYRLQTDEREDKGESKAILFELEEYLENLKKNKKGSQYHQPGWLSYFFQPLSAWNRICFYHPSGTTAQLLGLKGFVSFSQFRHAYNTKAQSLLDQENYTKLKELNNIAMNEFDNWLVSTHEEDEIAVGNELVRYPN